MERDDNATSNYARKIQTPSEAAQAKAADQPPGRGNAVGH